MQTNRLGTRAGRSLAALSLTIAIGACGNSITRTPDPVVEEKPDLAKGFEFTDDGGDVPLPTDDAGDPGTPSEICGDNDPNCMATSYGPPDKPFSLQTDQMKDPLERDNGVNRDAMTGYLKLDSTHSAFNYLWIANASQGTTSKIDSKTIREVARYSTVTCFSLKTGSKDACDGTKGCCSIDDWTRYQDRKAKRNQSPHQAVQVNSNDPSRTSVDFNGDLFISNRAFGGQSSVTHVANDVANCIDRNKNGRIDTSKDSNGDGLIQIDCNGDGQPDDIASVKAKPCSNGLSQEFYGVEDECILWTSNTFAPNAIGRPLGLAQGANDANVSDAWAGSYQNGNFVRIDGTTGLDKDDAQLPQGCNPYGLAVDASGVGWAPNLGQGKLCYFNTKNTMEVGAARGTMNGYGVTLDRDQNIWVGLSPARYTPDRSNGFKNLGNGWWTFITGASGIGIAADSRTANNYWVWSCGQGVLGIPASTIPLAKMDQNIPIGNNWPKIQMSCRGVGVDSDQNIWGVDSNTVTRALVDKMGGFKAPQQQAPMGNNQCPAGDMCSINAGAYTYSDFTGFGLRNFTRPTGSYSVILPGCTDVNKVPTDTQWFSVVWDADVPPNTSLTVHARAANSADLADPSWQRATYTAPAQGISPLLLQDTLMPNVPQSDPSFVANDAYLQVEFLFKTSSQNASPKLKSFSVGYKCGRIPG